jgi:dihydrofolate reductase
VKASEKEMEEKVRLASCNLKILDFDFGEATDDRGWMVRTVLNHLKGDVYPEDRSHYDKVMRKTRIVIMGRKTSSSSFRGKTVYTVPILLECQNRTDAADLDVILKKAGYFSTFHWPQEMIEFVNGIREEVRKMGYKEQTHYIRVRPEERNGGIQIRADVKERNGGRFVPKAVWQCPPVNKNLWERITGLYEARLLGGGRRNNEERRRD